MLVLFQSLKKWLLAVFAGIAVLYGVHIQYDFAGHSMQSVQTWADNCISDTFLEIIKDNNQQLSEPNEKVVISDENNAGHQNVKIYINDDSQREELAKLGLSDRPIIHIQDIDRKIHGRFLHITDMHPDMFYKTNTSMSSACHSGKGMASKFGDAFTNCDAPYILVKETIEWIDKNLKDKIDFVIWTGDNVRHDNDREIPRTEFQIFETNENISLLLFESFKDRKSLDPRQMVIPLIPSVGNNDVYPHNLFALGPTLQTRLMYKLWLNYIPQDQAHVFEQNACFMVEVIPNQLAVISLNTLFLFKSNPLVDNCDQKRQPGYSIFLWLGFTLKELRRRNMKVWLSGHVPPAPKNYDLTCYRKYVLWVYEFRDIIIGSVFGHMNLDHFLPLDAESAYKSLKKDTSMPGYSDLVSTFATLNIDYSNIDNDDEDEEDASISLEELYALFGLSTGDHEDNKYESAYLSSELHVLGASPGVNKVDYMNDVSEIFYSKLVSSEDVELEDVDLQKKKKKKKKKYSVDPNSRYSVAHVAGSVIPTFNPAFRVWEYNITDLDTIVSTISNPNKHWDEFFVQVNSKIDEILSDEDYSEEFDDIFGNDDELVTVMKNKHKKKKKNDKTIPKQSPTNMTLGPAFVPQTFSPTRFVQYYLNLAKHNSVNNGEDKIEYTIEYTSDSGPYKMDSLLVKDWVKYGKALAAGQTKKKSTNNKYWRSFLERVFISSDYEEWAKKKRKMTN